jgi:hypothetical protein
MYNGRYVCTCGQADRACRGLYSSYTMHVSLECKGGVPRRGSCSSDALELVLVQVAARATILIMMCILRCICVSHFLLPLRATSDAAHRIAVHELLAFTERIPDM